jgi:hypothetical protein
MPDAPNLARDRFAIIIHGKFLLLIPLALDLHLLARVSLIQLNDHFGGLAKTKEALDTLCHHTVRARLPAVANHCRR